MSRATAGARPGVSYSRRDGASAPVRADIVVLAPSAIETARLLLLSANAKHPHGLGNRSGQVGRNLMFHHFTTGVGAVHRAGPLLAGAGDLVHARRLRRAGHRPRGASRPACPYFKGGICEVGGGVLLLEEAQLYTELPNAYGAFLKSLLRGLALRDHIAGIQMMGEDVPQLANRVDLDPQIRDFHGLPVPRITYSPHRFELAAAAYSRRSSRRSVRAAPGINQSVQSLVDQLSARTRTR